MSFYLSIFLLLSNDGQSISLSLAISPSLPLCVDVPAPELKKSIYHVCGQFGKVLEVNANKTLSGRGQAFVIFDDIASATRAVRDMSNFMFYGKAMVRGVLSFGAHTRMCVCVCGCCAYLVIDPTRIRPPSPNQRVAYSKNKSDVISQRDGSFVQRPKRKMDGAESGKSAAKHAKKPAAASSSSSSSSSSSATFAAGARASMIDDEVPPNAVLFVQQLPAEATQPMVAARFRHALCLQNCFNLSTQSSEKKYDSGLVFWSHLHLCGPMRFVC